MVSKLIALIIAVLMLNLAYITILLIKRKVCSHNYIYIRRCVKCGKVEKGMKK